MTNSIVDPSSNSDVPPRSNKWSRAALNVVGGAVPFLGGFLSAAAGVWSEDEQEKIKEAIFAWLQMLQDEMLEKQEAIVGIISRLDMQDVEIASRVRSAEYQSLLKKAFRNWAGTESRKKQEFIRNILSNAAASKIVSDDVVNLFIDWLSAYSEFHFAVIGELYRKPSSSRGEIWNNLGKGLVREDSAEADLFKLLVRDLSTGGIIRQERETDFAGNFVLKRQPTTKSHANSSQKVAKSAFDDTERYELTALGKQFVHYAMTELTTKIEYKPNFGEAA